MERDGGGLSHLLGQGFDAVEHVVTFGLEHRVPGQIDAIGVDELQYAKGHKYLTPVYQVDLDVTRLLWVGRERTIESFREFFTVIGDEPASNHTAPARAASSAAGRIMQAPGGRRGRYGKPDFQ